MNKIITDYDRERLRISQEITDLVAGTAGPWGTNVNIFTPEGPRMYRDGMRVLENYDPKGLMAHGIKSLMLDSARRTVRAAGDGSTSTTILLNAIYANAIRMMEGSKYPISRREVGAGIRAAAQWAIDYVDREAERLDLSDADAVKTLRDIATLAGGNDPEIGDVIVDALMAVGVDGDISSEFDSRVEKITMETRPGYKLPFGVIHPSMLPTGRATVLVQDAFCAFVAEALNTNEQLNFILRAWKALCDANQALQPLVIFCAAIDGEALNTLMLRTATKGERLPWYCVRIQGNAEMWEDLESITGAIAPNGKQGRSITYFTAKNAVVIPKIILSEKNTVIDINQDALETSGLTYRIAEKFKDAPAEEADVLRTRMARLEGRTGTIKVPVGSAARRHWLGEVVEDSYLAARSACKEGFCPGAGQMLCEVGNQIPTDEHHNRNIGSRAFAESMFEVTMALLTNGGIGLAEAADVVVKLHDSGGATIALTPGNQALLGSGRQALLVDAKKWGILDSAAAIKAAIRFSAEEAADWVETPNAVTL